MNFKKISKQLSNIIEEIQRIKKEDYEIGQTKEIDEEDYEKKDLNPLIEKLLFLDEEAKRLDLNLEKELIEGLRELNQYNRTNENFISLLSEAIEVIQKNIKDEKDEEHRIALFDLVFLSKKTEELLQVIQNDQIDKSLQVTQDDQKNSKSIISVVVAPIKKLKNLYRKIQEKIKNLYKEKEVAPVQNSEELSQSSEKKLITQEEALQREKIKKKLQLLRTKLKQRSIQKNRVEWKIGPKPKDPIPSQPIKKESGTIIRTFFKYIDLCTTCITARPKVKKKKNGKTL